MDTQLVFCDYNNSIQLVYIINNNIDNNNDN